jgi:hypothetical protein
MEHHELHELHQIRQLIQDTHSMIERRLGHMEKTIMGLKEDFAAFVAAVNVATNDISAALDQIKVDIAALLANNATPPEVADGISNIEGQLTKLSDAAKAIAKDNAPVVPPVPAV